MTLATAHPIEDPLVAYRRILDFALDPRSTPRSVYTRIYCQFFNESQVWLPGPPKHDAAKRKLYLDRGRQFTALPELDRDRIVVNLYDMLRRITPDFKSDLNSVPTLMKWAFPWPQLLELRLPALIHDWFYHLSRKYELWKRKGFRKLVDILFLDQMTELATFSRWFVKPCYWSVASWRYPAVRAFGWIPFRWETD